MRLQAVNRRDCEPHGDQDCQKLPDPREESRPLGEKDVRHYGLFRAYRHKNQEEKRRRKRQGRKDCAGNRIRAEQEQGRDGDRDQRMNRGAMQSQVAFSDR